MKWLDRLINRVRALLRGESTPPARERRVLVYRIRVVNGIGRLEPVMIDALDADTRRRLKDGLELDLAWASVGSATTGKSPEMPVREA